MRDSGLIIELRIQVLDGSGGWSVEDPELTVLMR